MAPLPGGRSSRPDPRGDAYAAREPYFSVLASQEFLRDNLDAARERAFFESGDLLVDAMYRIIELRLAPYFAPTAVLEYGCGAGRLAFPLARRAARRNGTVTAVDASASMLDLTRREAARRELGNITFQPTAAFFESGTSFDFVVCYLVLQRMRPADGLGLLRHLVGRIRPGGIGAFQIPYRLTAPPLLRASRWARGRLPGANAVANLLRGKSIDEPFTPCHAYRLDSVMRVLHEASADAAHVVFERHAGFASAIVFAEVPVRRGAARPVHPDTAIDACPAPEHAESGASAPIAVKDIIAGSSIEDLNRAAEDYFATLPDREYHLAKPFGNAEETPQLLIDVATVVQGLKLKPGVRVLEFGAGSGWLSRFLTQLGCRVIVLDVSATALRLARELYERVPVVGDRPAPEFLLFDGRHIDLADSSVDRVVSLHAFHHAPNPDEVIAELGRILSPGGIAAFAEPGPDHSRSAPSQFEMKNYRVVENDVDVHAIWRTAQACGFADLKLAVFHGQPFHLSLEQFEDLLAGGDTGETWLRSTRVFMRNVRSFFLVKAGGGQADSHAVEGLACEIHPSAGRARGREGHPVVIDVTVTNSGQARWLASDVPHGGVAVGAHLYDESGQLLALGVCWGPLTSPPRGIAPGETVHCRVEVPAQPAGRYAIEIDCVSSQVMWFAQLGSRPARVLLEVDEESGPA
jgi:SAM-dependent methyltransferase